MKLKMIKTNTDTNHNTTGRRQRLRAIWVLPLLGTIACVDASSGDAAAMSSAIVGSECLDDMGCAVYEQCLLDGSVFCGGGACFVNGTANVGCLQDVEPSPASCGVVAAPPEQAAIDPSDVRCKFVAALGPDAPWGRPMLQATADTLGSTIRIHRLSLYGVLDDGRTVAIAGTDFGETTITWAEHDDLATWYRNEAQKEIGLPIPPDFVFDVPVDRVLHLGNVGTNASDFVDVFVVGEATTTGDAQIQFGLDFYAPDGVDYAREGGFSDWGACTTGAIRLSTPHVNAPTTCDGSTGTQCDPSAELCGGGKPDACPASGVVVTPGATLLQECPGLITRTWGASGDPLSSQPGGSLTFEPWAGVAYVTTICGGTEHVWVSGQSLEVAGFDQVCVSGVDRTATDTVVWDPYSTVYRPAVPLF